MKKGKGKTSKLLPNSLRIISSCIRTVSTNASTAVRSAGASVAASISSPGDDRKEQVDVPDFFFFFVCLYCVLPTAEFPFPQSFIVLLLLNLVWIGFGLLYLVLYCP